MADGTTPINWVPQRKFGAQMIGGAIATLAVGYMTRHGVTLSAEEIGSLVVVVGGVLHYFVPNAE